MIEQTGLNGVGLVLEADPSGTAIRARGPVSHPFVDAVTLVRKTRGNRTVALDLAAVRGLRGDGAVTLALTGPAARLVDCDGEIRSTDLRTGAGILEDRRFSLIWIGNRALPLRGARLPRSRFFATSAAGAD